LYMQYIYIAIYVRVYTYIRAYPYTFVQNFKRLASPHVARFYGRGYSANRPKAMFIVTEQGVQTLREPFRTGVPTRNSILKVLLQSSEAIEFLHKTGYVHGDIKPSNVILLEDGRPVLIDVETVTVPDGRKKVTGTKDFRRKDKFGTKYNNEVVSYSTDMFALGELIAILLDMYKESMHLYGDSTLAYLVARMTQESHVGRPTAADVTQVLQYLYSNDSFQVTHQPRSSLIPNVTKTLHKTGNTWVNLSISAKAADNALVATPGLTRTKFNRDTSRVVYPSYLTGVRVHCATRALYGIVCANGMTFKDCTRLACLSRKSDTVDVLLTIADDSQTLGGITIRSGRLDVAIGYCIVRNVLPHWSAVVPGTGNNNQCHYIDDGREWSYTGTMSTLIDSITNLPDFTVYSVIIKEY
jgi:hypothetical protein